MPLDMYFREDIRNVLRATFVASEGSAGLAGELLHDPTLQNVPLNKLLYIYRKGFVNALGAVGVAFGLDAGYRDAEQGLRSVFPPEPDRSALEYSTPMQSDQPVGAAQGPQELDLADFLWVKAQYQKQRS